MTQSNNPESITGILARLLDAEDESIRLPPDEEIRRQSRSRHCRHCGDPGDAEKPEDKLPYCHRESRVSPSLLLRSALFGIIQRGKRKRVDNKVLAAWKGVSLRYDGWRLDQHDLDVWLHAVSLCRNSYRASDTVEFTARGFLKGLGRATGGRSMAQLTRSIERMIGCLVVIETRGIIYMGSLIDGCVINEDTGLHELRLSKEIKSLFDEGYTRLKVRVRRALKSDLAKWLYGYLMSHRATDHDPHRIALARLMELSGSAMSSRLFKSRIKESMDALIDLRVVKSWRFTPNNALEAVRHYD